MRGPFAVETANALDSGITALHERFEAHRQGHVFRFWDRLDAAGRERLSAQAAALDLPGLLRALEICTRGGSADQELEPIAVERAPGNPAESERVRATRERGEALLAAGRVAAVVVAGGQGTRLGFDGPKGAYPIGPVTRRSLFGVQAQKLRGLRRRFGCPLPWYVMTSPATDADTRAFFEREDHFGLPAGDVAFFRQGMVPSFDFAGRLILERPDRIFENPDGHGGSLTALLVSGMLDDMEQRGVDTVFYYQVDNPLVRIGDPLFLGFHQASGAEMSCKVVRKQDPEEKVGVVAQVDGRVTVVEYTELTPEHRFARDPDGDLTFWAGNAAIHVFATSFIRRVARDAERLLPFHASAKRIPTLDDDGRTVEPREANGLKLERFVFDALPAARAVCVVEALRDQEYSPVKNASGADSPATARRDLVRQYRCWLEAAQIDLPPAGTDIEIDHSRVDGPDDVRALGVRSTAEAGDAIRISSGADT